MREIEGNPALHRPDKVRVGGGSEGPEEVFAGLRGRHVEELGGRCTKPSSVVEDADASSPHRASSRSSPAHGGRKAGVCGCC